MRKRKKATNNNNLDRKMALFHVVTAQKESVDFMGDIFQLSPTILSRTTNRFKIYTNIMREMLESKGGKLEIRVKFPNATINLERLGDTKHYYSPDSK